MTIFKSMSDLESGKLCSASKLFEVVSHNLHATTGLPKFLWNIETSK